MQNHIFNITHDRDFLQHFLTDWRTKSISPEMVEKLKENSESDPYAAYGYGRWLSLVNPDGKSIRKAELLLTWAGSNGVQDANAALARMFYEGRIEADEAMPQMHAFLIDSAYKQGSELAQYQTLENIIYGDYGVQENPSLAADILKKHLEKNPESDPIYYDLLGQALESSDTESAEKTYISSLERGNTESYYSLANLYRTRGEESRACAIAEEGEDDLDLEALSSRTEARGYDVVHYSPILSRITKTLSLDKESCHLAMLVDKDGLMRDLPDNMVGTLVYGQGQEIRGTVVFVLEDDNTYRLMPMKGLQRIYMFLQMLGAATGDLMRQPSSEELEAIGMEDSGGFEVYDDPDILDDESWQEQENEENMVAVDTSREEEPRELVVPVAEVKEGINNCNLCIDTLIVTLPDSREFWFMSTADLIFKLGIKSTIENNIERHGGYMIDEWQYVDARQIPMDIRSHIVFKYPDEK